MAKVFVKIKKMKRGWYWSLHSGSNTVAVGGEPFKSRYNAKRSFQRVEKLLDKCPSPVEIVCEDGKTKEKK